VEEEEDACLVRAGVADESDGLLLPLHESDGRFLLKHSIEG
jgi:hypothetical protein